jgi:hypothetical protein
MAEAIQWEYRVQTTGSSFSAMKDEALEALLDAWGEEGWEVISVHPLGSSNKVRVIARRRLSLEARRQRTWPSL